MKQPILPATFCTIIEDSAQTIKGPSETNACISFAANNSGESQEIKIGSLNLKENWTPPATKMKGMGMTSTLLCAVLVIACIDAAEVQGMR